MKFNNKTYKSLAGALLIAVSAQGLLTSCDDFLSIEPQNEVVLENFWTEEADVNSVLASCYAKLASVDCIKRMIVWGESRSDDMVAGSNIGSDYALSQIFKENILETNTYTNWQSFYEAINRCNTVMHYAPEVNAIDPNFTDAELRAVMAEATTLRTLSYFYLIRAFRNVPYVTEPSIDDTQVYQVPAMPFDEVLDNLIADMESVKDDAVRSYGEDSDDNKFRVTRWACYALLADLYLWKGEWQKCIDYCDLVINEKIKEHEEGFSKNPTQWPVYLFDGYPLISDYTNNTVAGSAYGQIFGNGRSFESIFEFNGSSERSVENKAVADFYGTSQGNGLIGVPSFIREGVFDGTNKYFKKTDMRYLENTLDNSSKYFISKYVYTRVSIKTDVTIGEPKPDPASTSKRSANDANWIIYRLTDVMLMRAEAEIEMADSAPSEEQLQHYKNAFDIILAVWKRSNNKRTSNTDLLKFDDYNSSRYSMEDLLLEERHRELMFEGKRWFDLVRFCRRYNDNTRLVQKVSSKFQENANVIRLKLATQDALYWPYNRNELKQNPYLVQNPAYETDNTERN